ncbi:MAG: hypothetical protein M0R02_07840 [Bacteroidales bacterium]|jgi:RHS repeat-associated protein|nr:hypothetical protein [Bacteroidales bacterium]NLK80710.1 hypothetical protein [Bacteroidales bacterium]
MVLKEHNKPYKTKYYVGAYEKEIMPNGSTRELHYIDGVGIYVLSSSGTREMYYTHKDHLGSITEITDSQGAVVESLSYDAWGNRRNPHTWASDSTAGGTFLFDRGYTGHEHLDDFAIINMNGRIYEPLTGRMMAPDNYVQSSLSQNLNRYSYCLNNPLIYTDPDGDFIFTAAVLVSALFTSGATLALLPTAIGADLGMWQGGSLANGTMNPLKWDYSSGKTWGYMAGGAVVGGASGFLGGMVATSGMPMANTAGVVAGSFVNSAGTFIYTGGQTDMSVSLGVVSYNFNQNELGYLGKKGNSTLENIGYGLGLLANVSDVLAGFNPGEVQLNTENSDAVGHSALTKVGETNPHNSLVSVGPDPGGKWIFNPFKFKNGTNDWNNYVNASKDVWKVGVEGVNLERIANYGANLNKGVNYNLYFSSCVNHTARALTLAGAPAIGIHPFILHSQMVLRSVGFRPMLYSYYLNQY